VFLNARLQPQRQLFQLPRRHRPGTIVGKALEDLPAGTGDILVLLTLQ